MRFDLHTLSDENRRTVLYLAYIDIDRKSKIHCYYVRNQTKHILKDKNKGTLVNLAAKICV